LLDERPVGAALSKDIKVGEKVDASEALDLLIERRDRERRKSEGERAEEMAWKESVRRYDAKRNTQLSSAWGLYHQGQAQRLRAALEALIAHHEGQAQRYQ